MLLLLFRRHLRHPRRIQTPTRILRHPRLHKRRRRSSDHPRRLGRRCGGRWGGMARGGCGRGAGLRIRMRVPVKLGYSVRSGFLPARRGITPTRARFRPSPRPHTRTRSHVRVIRTRGLPPPPHHLLPLLLLLLQKPPKLLLLPVKFDTQRCRRRRGDARERLSMGLLNSCRGLSVCCVSDS